MSLQSSMVNDKDIARYIDQRRQLVDSFIAHHYSCRGTLAVFWRTLKTDVVRHPINFVLSIPFLFVGKAAGWLERFGWYSAARVLNKVPLRLQTAFENVRELQVVVELLGLSGEPESNELLIALADETEAGDAQDRLQELRDVLAVPINAFMATRAAILDLASGGLTVAVAYSFFGNLTLSPYEMAQQLASSSAREQATSNFVLGRGIGSAFYHLFPPRPTVPQILTSCALLFLLLGALTALLSVLSDPVQKSLGILRRQLNRLLNSCEASLLLHEVKRQRQAETGPGMEANPGREGMPRWTESPTEFPNDFMLQPRSADLGSPPKKWGGPLKLVAQKIVRGRSTWAPRLKAGFGRFYIAFASLLEAAWGRGRIALASLPEARFGRGPIFLGGLGASVVLALVCVWAYRRMDPYLEVQRLIERKAFVTAVARLDQVPKEIRSGAREGDYWYWRGRALMGNKQLDAAMEAYRSATLKTPRYRKDSTLVRDATEAVASKDHEKAKHLLLEQIGPSAIDPLLQRALATDDVHRWSLVELIKKLGGEEQVNYQKVAIADLASATSCQAKKRALEKISEYRVKAAIPTLRQLDGQPQFKCLQNALKPTIAKLEASR